MSYGARGYGGRAVGDPGIFSVFKKIAKVGLKLGGLVLPGPAGAAARFLGGGGGPPQIQPPARRGLRIPQISLRGAGAVAAPGFGAAGVGQLALAPGAGADGCPKGTRLNKSNYFLQSGQFVARGSRCVSYRRTNPANARALRRALRREEAFIKLARRSGLVALPKARRVRRAAGKK